MITYRDIDELQNIVDEIQKKFDNDEDLFKSFNELESFVKGVLDIETKERIKEVLR